jgi:hypothetical protein
VLMTTTNKTTNKARGIAGPIIVNKLGIDCILLYGVLASYFKRYSFYVLFQAINRAQL